jgi:hypothetical protein
VICWVLSLTRGDEKFPAGKWFKNPTPVRIFYIQGSLVTILTTRIS